MGKYWQNSFNKPYRMELEKSGMEGGEKGA